MQVARMALLRLWRFGAPLMLHAGLRDGSLRAAATDAGVTVLLYEGGEAWRFDEDAIAKAIQAIRATFAYHLKKKKMSARELDKLFEERLTTTTSLDALKDVDLVIEAGPGKVLAGLNKRIDKTLQTLPVLDPAGLDAAMEAANA